MYNPNKVQSFVHLLRATCTCVADSMPFKTKGTCKLNAYIQRRILSIFELCIEGAL